MPFDRSQFLTLAAELAERTDEASLRSALSRTYYYVYHLALKRADDNGFKHLPGEAMHAQLWRLFNDNPEPDCRKLAEIGARLKDERQRADYNTIFARIQDEVPDVLADARDFAARLSRLPSRHPNPKS